MAFVAVRACADELEAALTRPAVPAVSVERLKALEQEWRTDANELDEATGGQWVEPGVRIACADELAALIAQAEGDGQ